MFYTVFFSFNVFLELTLSNQIFTELSVVFNFEAGKLKTSLPKPYVHLAAIGP